jgi:cadmium resistance protein CadD (predicted permease)
LAFEDYAVFAGLITARSTRSLVRAPRGTIGVSSIRVANRADSIAVYAPLFATIGPGGFATTVIVFAVMVAVWCAAGFLVGTHNAVARAVHWGGDCAIPVVLIALGILIIAKSGMLGVIFG